MQITTIELPIYDLDIVIVINDWDQLITILKKRFAVKLTQDHYDACGLTIYNEPGIDDNEIWLLLKKPYLNTWTVCHELMHIISGICELRGIVMDPKNDEALAYLQGYIGERVFEFIEKSKTKK